MKFPLANSQCPIASLTLTWLAIAYGINIYGVNAQIIPDATLPVNSVVNNDGNINVITGGTTAGGNLFHSFGEFSLPTGSSAFFNNASDISNIFTRVTGGNISNIDGLIRANGAANLFLLNPNGILFGANASLNIGGSFLGSTANSILFDDGSSFSAKEPNASPILTVNLPIGLQLGQNPGEIQVLGNGSNLAFDQSFATFRDDRRNGFAVNPGQTLALVGGNIAIAGGNLTAPGGQIELGSVLNGEVTLTPSNSGWDLSYPGVENFGDIRLSQAGSVDASGNGGGYIHVQGRRITVQEGAAILADTLGNAPGREIIVRGTESVEVTGLSDLFISSLFTAVAPGASGNGGNLTIETERFVLSDDAIIGADTFGAGNAGILTVRATDIESSDLATWSGSTFAEATGNGGKIVIETARLRVTEGSQILAFTLGAGNAGEISVTATELVEVRGDRTFGDSGFNSVLAATVEPGGTGNAGNLTIDTVRLVVANGGGISTGTDAPSASRGDSRITPTGNLTIRATESVEVIGNDTLGVPSSITTNSFVGAPGGDLTLATPRLIIRNGGQISTGTFDTGQGGNLTIQVSDKIDISGSTPAQEVRNRDFFKDESGTLFPSGLFTSSEASGHAGDLSIQAGSISIRDRAEIAVSSIGKGGAGSLSIASPNIRLDNLARLRADNTAGLGNIHLITRDLRLNHNSRISTNSQGKDPGGNITIGTATLVALDNSDITANARQSAGGQVSINAEAIFATQFRPTQTPLSDITATSALGLQFSGTVDINTPDIDAAAGLVELDRDIIDLARLIDQNFCSVGEDSEFTVTGRGGLPNSPKETLNPALVLDDLRFFSENTRAEESDSIDVRSHSRDLWKKPGRHNSTISGLNNQMPILEAQGLVVAADGTVILVAEAPEVTPHGSGLPVPQCY